MEGASDAPAMKRMRADDSGSGEGSPPKTANRPIEDKPAPESSVSDTDKALQTFLEARWGRKQGKRREWAKAQQFAKTPAPETVRPAPQVPSNRERTELR